MEGTGTVLEHGGDLIVNFQQTTDNNYRNIRVKEMVIIYGVFFCVEEKMTQKRKQQKKGIEEQS